MDSLFEGGCSKSADHVELVGNLIKYGTEDEKVNYRAYLKALKDGLLEGHRGRYLFVNKGKLFNKSFKRPHDILDHFPASPEDLFTNFEKATIVYVPVNRE